MKRILITSAIALCAIAIGASVFQGLAKIQTERYVGRDGWMMLQHHFFTNLEGKKEKVDVVLTAYGSDGSWRKKTTIRNEKGKATCTRVIAFVPGRGTFEEDQHNSRLSFINEMTARPMLDIPAGHFRSEDGYLGDEVILDYRCAHFQNRHTDGSISESWFAYNLGGEELKRISHRAIGTHTWEPKTIKLGEPPAVAMKYKNEWPVDYTHFEKQVEQVQAVNSAKAGQMRAAMNKLKALP